MSLQFRSITHIYRDGGQPTAALRGFDLRVRKGEFVCLTGPSGCGKSTAIALAAGFMLPTQGRVEHDGKIVRSPGSERAVAFQEDAVFPWMKVRANVGYGPARKGLRSSDRDAIVRHYLKAVGLDEVADKYPRQLSGGMRKRVDIARAFASAPRLLLMDEPFGSLDVQTRKRMQEVLLVLWEAEQKTVLFVTHDIEEAALLADRIVVMSPRPGHVAEEFVVPFGRPRQIGLARTERFMRLRWAVEAALHTVRPPTLA